MVLDMKKGKSQKKLDRDDLMNEYNNAIDLVAQYEEKKAKKKAKQKVYVLLPPSVETNGQSFSQSAEYTEVASETDARGKNVIYLEPITSDEADLLKGEKLKDYLKVHRIAYSNLCVEDMRFKLKSFLHYLELNEHEKEIVRNNVLQIVGSPENTFSRILSDLNLDRKPSYIPEANLRSYFMDWESCYRSENYWKSNCKRPGGKLFYQTAKVSVFDQKGMGSYAKREYIEPLPRSAKNKDKFNKTAESEEIRTAKTPSEVMTVWARFDEELNVYGNILIFYWANNYFDINMLDNALAETGTMNPPFVTYCNAMKLVRFLVPGLNSYALEELHKTFGFGDYNAHDAMADCIASWKCLLFAVHCYLGPYMQLTLQRMMILETE